MPHKARGRECGSARCRSLRRRLRHYGLANLRDLRVLFREFRLTLVLFLALVCIATVVFHGTYVEPESGRRLGMTEALYAVFCLVFVQPTIPFPQDWHLRALFFLIPIMGLGLLGEGIVRFGVLLFSKQSRMEEWQVALASTYSNHVIVCGVGRLGYRVVEQLLECGEEIVAVERDADNQFLESVRARHVPVILGDACQADVLRKAGVARARCIIPCTESDLANLEIALNAVEEQPDVKVVLRMFEPELAQKVQRGFGIHTALSTSALAAPAFAAAVVADLLGSFKVDKETLLVVQTYVAPGSELAGRRVSEVEKEFDLSIILTQGGGKTELHPAPELTLAAGDRVVVAATLPVLTRFRRANQGARVGA